MKNVIVFIYIFLLWGAKGWAFTFDEAMSAYNQRGLDASGISKARLAVKLGSEIANNNENAEIAARGNLISCKALFFIAEYAPGSRAEKKEDFKNSSDYCQRGISLIELTKGKAQRDEWNLLLGELYFYYTSSFGRWFEDESKLRALSYWRDDVKPLLELLEEKMGLSHIYGEGPSRALGRAYFTIPGGRGRSAKYLKEAYDNSLHSTLGVSVYPLTTAYYAEALIAKGEKKEALEILEKTLDVADSKELEQLHQEALQKYGEYRWVETQEEINLCREIYKGLI